MKSKFSILFTILSLAAIASCTKVDLAPCGTADVQPNASDVISFSINETKSTTIDTDNLQSFKVSANYENGGGVFFKDVVFTKGSDGYYTSENTYYWPKSGYLKFYAYAYCTDADWSKESSQICATSSTSFDIEPSDDPSLQVDFIFASATASIDQAHEGVPLSFSNVQSRVNVAFVNSSDAYSFEVNAVKVAGVSTKGTFNFSSGWAAQDAPSVGNSYILNLADPLVINSCTSSSVPCGDSFFLVPLPSTGRLPKADAYTSSDKGSSANGSYIAVCLKVYNKAHDQLIAGSGNGIWAMWPVAFEFTQGESYNFVIDLSGSGSHERNLDGDNPKLDPLITPFFSVSATDKVMLAPGNLQYQPSTLLWRFAQNQYDFVGFDYYGTHYGNVTSGSIICSNDRMHDSSYNGWIDLFGWGTADNPTLSSLFDADYSVYKEWGANVEDSYSWFTLSGGQNSQWNYLLTQRKMLNGGERYKNVSVCGVTGLMLFPDCFNGSEVPSVIATDDDFVPYAKAGCIFLPVTGSTNSTGSFVVPSIGYYWSSTKSGDGDGCYYVQSTDPTGLRLFNASLKAAVRLAREIVLE